MAGEWIKLDCSTPEKPEVFKIARILGIDADAVVGKLMRLWAWIDTVSVDGVVDGVVDADVDRICRADGFARACASVGWLLVDAANERVSLPNFDNHNGETAKQRALKNRRQAKWRAASSTCASTSPSTNASTREEKRREEEKQEKGASAPTHRKPKGITLAEWIEGLAGAEAIPADDPLFDWAAKVGLPREWVALAWWAFEGRYTLGTPQQQAKRYTDWRAAFRDHVTRDFLGLWKLNRDGQYFLTTAGQQALRESQA